MINNSLLQLDPTNWVLTGELWNVTVKTLADLPQTFLNVAGVNPATPLYHVHAYSKGDVAVDGNLYAGMTTLFPLTINGEYNMTRGHVHRNRHAAEFYIGVAGRGLLLLMDKDRACTVERVEPGSIHYIPGDVAHRLVNDSDNELRVFAVWPTTAGHDYEAIEPAGFSLRVFSQVGIVPAKA